MESCTLGPVKSSLVCASFFIFRSLLGVPHLGVFNLLIDLLHRRIVEPVGFAAIQVVEVSLHIAETYDRDFASLCVEQLHIFVR